MVAPVADFPVRQRATSNPHPPTQISSTKLSLLHQSLVRCANANQIPAGVGVVGGRRLVLAVLEVSRSSWRHSGVKPYHSAARHHAARQSVLSLACISRSLTRQYKSYESLPQFTHFDRSCPKPPTGGQGRTGQAWTYGRFCTRRLGWGRFRTPAIGRQADSSRLPFSSLI